MEHCFQTNPDGAGYMWVGSDGYVHIRKGYMTFDAFLQAYERRVFTERDLIVLHFRIGTSGGKCPETCHPFPLTQDVSLLRTTSVKTRWGVAHNGILSKGSAVLSDTQLFVRDMLGSPVVRENLQDPGIRKLVETAIGKDRIVVIGGDDTTYTFGRWEEDGGMLFSNSYFRNRRPEKTIISYANGKYESLPLFSEFFPPWKKEEQEEEEKPTALTVDFKCPICGNIEYSITWMGWVKCAECGKQFNPELFQQGIEQ